MRKLDEEDVWLVVRYTSVMYIKLFLKTPEPKRTTSRGERRRPEV